MQESIKKIIISLLVIIFIIIIYMLYINYLSNSLDYLDDRGIGIDNRTIDINILDEGILCEDIIVFNLTQKRKINYNFFKDSEYLSNVKIYINNKQVNLTTGIENGNISLDEFALDFLKITPGTKATIKLIYEIDKDYIKRYEDTDAFPFYIDLYWMDYLNNLTINLSSNYAISNLTIKNAEVSQNRNKYIINMDNLEKSTNINMLFNINTNLDNVINMKYINEEILREKAVYSYINERADILVICVSISVIMFIISFIINKRIRVNNYRRETSDLVSPILAEVIVDGKIGLKELIMTTIIDLNIRGNINIIDNTMIELISHDNLETYEKNIVDLLFRSNNKIKFGDINNIFAKSNQGTLRFTRQFNKIKELLLEKIFTMNIFSKRLTTVNKVVTILCILLCINLPQIFIKDVSMFSDFFFMISALITVFYIKKNTNKTTIQEEIINHKNRKWKGKKVIILVIFILFCMIGSFINGIKYHMVFIIITLLTIMLNIYTAYRSQAIVLTREGKREQAKLIELKNYINDYSLMKDRDLRSVIIWDEYLAYATAFGIPNKVTNTIYEGWHNLNLNLQVIEKVLR